MEIINFKIDDDEKNYNYELQWIKQLKAKFVYINSLEKMMNQKLNHSDFLKMIETKANLNQLNKCSKTTSKIQK